MNSRSFRTFFILMLLFLFLFCACTGKTDPKRLEGAQPDAPVESDGGWACKQGDWIYFINGDNFTRLQERFHPFRGALCRMRASSGETDVVVSEDVSAFHILGEYIYYVAYENGKSVSCRIKSDATGKERLAVFDSVYDGGGYAFCGEVIYYIRDGCLYRMQADGTRQERLTRYQVYNIRAGERYLYFTQALDLDGFRLGPLYRIGKDEAEPVKLTDAAAYTLYVGEETAYYYLLANGYCYALDQESLQVESIAHSAYEEYLFIEDENLLVCSYTTEDKDGIYTMPLNGGERKKISADKATRMLYDNQYIYYINITELYSMYRMKTDGTERVEMTADMISDLDELDLVDGWIYYFSENDDGRIYRIRVDDFYHECIEYETFGAVGE